MKTENLKEEEKHFFAEYYQISEERENRYSQKKEIQVDKIRS